jgi:hypothetical protein
LRLVFKEGTNAIKYKMLETNIVTETNQK